MHSLFSRRQKPIVADVEFDPECGLWTVACDRLGVYTEAPTYEALIARFWEIAPEVAAENHFSAHQGQPGRVQADQPACASQLNGARILRAAT